MALNEILLKKVGRELREWLYLGIRTGMRRGVEEYNALKTIDSIMAISAIERAIDLPRRARARINEAIKIYSQQTIIDALQASGSTSILEMNNDLTLMETYAQGLYNRRTGGESWDSLAADIVTNISLESDKWVFPLPINYKDIWGK